MNPAIFILLSLAAMQATLQANPGDVVNLNITEPAMLNVSDACMYFVENLNSTLMATPGVHELKIGINCTEGIKKVYADGKELVEIEVSGLSCSNITGYAAAIERENMALEKKVENLNLKTNALQKEIKELKSKLGDAEINMRMLELENGVLKNELKKIKLNLNKTSQELEKKKDELAQQEERIMELNRQSSIYRIATFFLVSLFAGSYVALIYLSRKE
ncbi:coiled-coil domain-containing protein [Archaeoglobus neptunius]|uniref:hypothetical protein n=1 Tax=Archaeoglobus neptunius TaxID=2798580 RepID=UPI001926463F|nr:hypothetical protein [Archaeoglobus neptunius]